MLQYQAPSSKYNTGKAPRGKASHSIDCILQFGVKLFLCGKKSSDYLKNVDVSKLCRSAPLIWGFSLTRLNCIFLALFPTVLNLVYTLHSCDNKSTIFLDYTLCLLLSILSIAQSHFFGSRITAIQSPFRAYWKVLICALFWFFMLHYMLHNLAR